MNKKRTKLNFNGGGTIRNILGNRNGNSSYDNNDAVDLSESMLCLWCLWTYE